MSVLTGPKIIQMIGASLGDAYLTEGNLFLRGLQALLQANIISQTNTPPGSPNNGDTYIVGTSPTGAWASHANAIAYWTTQNLGIAAWDFWTPVEGWKTYDQTTNATLKFDGSAWVTDSSGGGPTLQVNGVANADQTLLNLADGVTISFSDNGSGEVSAEVFKYSGTVALSSGSAAVVMSPGYATTADYVVFVSYVNPLSSAGTLSVVYTNGTHFTIQSSNGADASTVAYMAIGN